MHFALCPGQKTISPRWWHGPYTQCYCTQEDLHSTGKKYIVQPLICHLQKRASVICEITLFVWDGCTFCSFTSDNDLDYVNLPVCLSLFWHLHCVTLEHSRCPRCLSNSTPDKSLNSLGFKVIKRTYWRAGGSWDTPSVEWAPVLFAVIHEIICQWDRKREALPSILFFIVSVQFCSCGFIAPREVAGAALPSIVSQLLLCVGSCGFLCSHFSRTAGWGFGGFAVFFVFIFGKTGRSPQMLPELEIVICKNVITLLHHWIRQRSEWCQSTAWNRRKYYALSSLIRMLVNKLFTASLCFDSRFFTRQRLHKSQ